MQCGWVDRRLVCAIFHPFGVCVKCYDCTQPIGVSTSDVSTSLELCSYWQDKKPRREGCGNPKLNFTKFGNINAWFLQNITILLPRQIRAWIIFKFGWIQSLTIFSSSSWQNCTSDMETFCCAQKWYIAPLSPCQVWSAWTLHAPWGRQSQISCCLVREGVGEWGYPASFAATRWCACDF